MSQDRNAAAIAAGTLGADQHADQHDHGVNMRCANISQSGCRTVLGASTAIIFLLVLLGGGRQAHDMARCHPLPQAMAQAHVMARSRPLPLGQSPHLLQSPGTPHQRRACGPLTCTGQLSAATAQAWGQCRWGCVRNLQAAGAAHPAHAPSAAAQPLGKLHIRQSARGSSVALRC